MNEVRRLLYRLARLLGDINAISKGKVGQRTLNKLIGRKGVSKAWAKGCGCLLPVVAVAAALALYSITTQ